MIMKEANEISGSDKFWLLFWVIMTPLSVGFLGIIYVLSVNSKIQSQLNNELNIKALEKGCVIIGR